MAVGHSILGAIYTMLRDGVKFEDLGGTHWDDHHRDVVARRSIQRLHQLGYRVTVEEDVA